MLACAECGQIGDTHAGWVAYPACEGDEDDGPEFPHAVPPLLQLAATLGGIVQVLHDPQHPSFVTLPTLGACPKPCKPLPVANLIRG